MKLQFFQIFGYSRTKKVILISIGLVILYFSYTIVVASIKTPNKIVQPQDLWNSKLVETYPDEPTFDDVYKISSSSAWIVPPDPYVITTDPIERWPIDRIFADENDLTEEDWSKSPYHKENLDSQNLDKKYYDHFFKKGIIPAAKLTKNVDVNGDGVKDKLFQGSNLGCASCHSNQIDIFIGDKRYQTFTNEGILTPRNDNKGFYIENAYMDTDFATCCPDNIIISKYEWNGDGFTEVARKGIWIKPKE